MFGAFQNIDKQFPNVNKVSNASHSIKFNLIRTIRQFGSPDIVEAQDLMKYLFGIGMLGCLLVLSVQVYTDNYKIFVPTFLWAVLFVVVYIFHQKGFKKLSFHILMICINLLNLYMVAIDGNNFQAIYSIYIVGLVFTFIYLKNIFTLSVYLVLGIMSQMVILYYNADVDVHGFSHDIIADGICLISTNFAIFLMCYFYLTNLEKASLKLKMSTADLDDQRKVLQERSNELSRYIESNIQLENYTHLAAHELKAPLRSVKGFADILKERIVDKLDEKEREMFNFISEKTEKMDVLLNDLSALGKVSQSELVKEYIDLDDLFRDILIDRNDQIKSKGANLDFELNVDHMVGQFGLIKQLFSNLIGNAIKFVDCTRRPKVLVTANMIGQELVFKVMDNGVGIKEEYRNRIFQIFERLHTESEFKGSGIGLSICKKIVDLHKGIISIEDSPLGGSCFTIRIPKMEL